MEVQHGFEDPAAYRGGFVTIGNFDGVHRGHQRMICALTEHGRRQGVPSVVFTFDPHPIEVLSPGKAPPALSTLRRKTELIVRLGVDCLIAYPTDDWLLNLSPQEFLEQVLQQELSAVGIVEGPNFCFGQGRAGTVETLREFGEQHDLTVDIVDAVVVEGVTVSSSGVRQAIREGRIADAVTLLGHPYQLTGLVQPGAARGTQLGFSTANLGGIETLLPADGVYAGTVELRGSRHAAGIHIGPNPTFGERERKCEVHLLGFAGGDLYGESISVDLLARIRDTMSFPDAAALQQQIAQDLSQIRTIVDDHK